MPIATDEASLRTDRPDDAVNAALVHRGPQANAPEQSRGDRRTSFDPADFPVPHGREEEWRFTPVDRLGTLLGDGAASGRVDVASELPDGVTLTTIPAEQARGLGIAAPGDRAAARAGTAPDGALHLAVAAEAEPAEPARLRLTGAGGAALGHLVLTVGRHARATVVLRHDGSAAYSQLLSVVAGDGADLTLISLQEWDDDAIHLAEHAVVVGRDARVRHIAVTLGGAIVRVATNTTYAGPGGSFEGLGLYFADDGQHLEHRLFVDHAQPRCTSNVVYKGALQGETAHTVWVGDVLIRASAEATDTYELNRNLVLTDGARADSVPNLEIETGEIVGAGHASATGRFDDEQLFYLMARGIPETEARRLVVRAFFAEIVQRIGLPEIGDRLMAAIEAELAASMGSSALPASTDADETDAATDDDAQEDQQ
jgi:Fe-S cluster assembly protein SufD